MKMNVKQKEKEASRPKKGKGSVRDWYEELRSALQALNMNYNDAWR